MFAQCFLVNTYKDCIALPFFINMSFGTCLMLCAYQLSLFIYNIIGSLCFAGGKQRWGCRAKSCTEEPLPDSWPCNDPTNRHKRKGRFNTAKYRSLYAARIKHYIHEEGRHRTHGACIARKLSYASTSSTWPSVMQCSKAPPCQPISDAGTGALDLD